MPIKPFSYMYVIHTTVARMDEMIDVSIRKTLERIQEFDGNQEKSQEVFRTLAALHMMRKQIKDFQLKG